MPSKIPPKIKKCESREKCPQRGSSIVKFLKLNALQLICIPERSVIEIGLIIQKSLIEYFVFVVKFLKKGLVKAVGKQTSVLVIGHILVMD